MLGRVRSRWAGPGRLESQIVRRNIATVIKWDVDPGPAGNRTLVA